jgi:hypothetical protein
MRICLKKNHIKAAYRIAYLEGYMRICFRALVIIGGPILDVPSTFESILIKFKDFIH